MSPPCGPSGDSGTRKVQKHHRTPAVGDEVVSMVAEGSGIRKRKRNFTTEEVSVLVDEVLHKYPYLSGSDIKKTVGTKRGYNQQKEAWEKIAQKVTSLGVSTRTYRDVRRKWQDMKYMAKAKGKPLRVENKAEQIETREVYTYSRNSMERTKLIKTEGNTSHTYDVTASSHEDSVTDSASDDEGSCNSEEPTEWTPHLQGTEGPPSPSLSSPDSSSEQIEVLSEMRCISASLRQIAEVSQERLAVEKDMASILHVLAEGLTSDVVPEGRTVNAQFYRDSLEHHLKAAIRCKRPH